MSDYFANIEYLTDKEKKEFYSVVKTSLKENKKNSFAKKAIREFSNFESFNDDSKLYFLSILNLITFKSGPNYFLHLKDFIVKNILDDSIKVRDGVVSLTKILIKKTYIDFYFLENNKTILDDFIEDLIILSEIYGEPATSNFSDVNLLEESKYKSIQLVLNILIGSKNKQKKIDYPKWLDCAWKRKKCNKKKCPICSKLDDVVDFLYYDKEDFLTDIAKNFTKKIGNKKKPTDFPLYREVENIAEFFSHTASSSAENGDFWIFTEEALDIFWYLNVLSINIYKQLLNRELIDFAKEPISNFNYQYTKIILSKSIKEINKNIKEIINHKPKQEKELKDIIDEFYLIEEKIINI